MDPVELTALLAQLGAIAVGTILLGYLLGSIARKAVANGGPLAGSHVQRLVQVSTWLAGAAFAAEFYGIRIDVLLVLFVLAGSAIIVANRDALQNLAARYYSDIYLQFRIGDRIRVREYSGEIIEMNPVSTMLITDADEVVAVPNSLLAREIVVNTTPYAGRDITIPITISNDVDLPSFEKKLLLSSRKLRLRLDDRLPPRVMVVQKTEKSTELRLMVRLKVPEKKDAIVRELESRVKAVVEELSNQKNKLLTPEQA